MSLKKLIVYSIVGLIIGISTYITTSNVNAEKNSKVIVSPTSQIALEDKAALREPLYEKIPTTLSQFATQPVDHYEVLINIDLDQPLSKKAMTLTEAWDIALQYAQNWSADAEFIYLYSSDARDMDEERLRTMNDTGGETFDEFQSQPKYQGLSLGQEGSRRAWLALLQSKSKGCELHVEITDGVVTYAGTDGGYQIRPILSQKPFIDSSEMITKALMIKPDLQMSTGKGRGYNFGYQADLSGKPELSLIALGEKNGELVPLLVIFDMDTKEAIFEFLSAGR
jgi:hypothetical protein